MFKFRVGEDIRLNLSVGATDTIDDVSAIEAKITPVKGGTAVAMTVTEQSNPLGWSVVLAANSLTPGRYIVDAKITSGSVIDITEQSAFVDISRAALT